MRASLRHLFSCFDFRQYPTIMEHLQDELLFFGCREGLLRGLDEFANAAGIALGVAVAGERVGAAAGFDEDVRPDHAGFDVDGGHLGNADADLVLAEPRTLVADDRLVRHFDDGGKEVVAAGPAAGFESFRFHAGSLTRITFSASELRWGRSFTAEPFIGRSAEHPLCELLFLQPTLAIGRHANHPILKQEHAERMLCAPGRCVYLRCGALNFRCRVPDC